MTPAPAAAQANLPPWVVSPEQPGFIRVVSSAPKQEPDNPAMQYRVAEMKARQQLAEMVRVRVQNTVDQSMTDRNGEVTASADERTRLASKAGLRLHNARVAEQWTDPRDGRLYILLELPE